MCVCVLFVFYLVVSDSPSPSAAGGSVEEWLSSITLLALHHSSFSSPLALPPGCCPRPPLHLPASFCCQPLSWILKNKEQCEQFVIRQKSTYMNYQRQDKLLTIATNITQHLHKHSYITST